MDLSWICFGFAIFVGLLGLRALWVEATVYSRKRDWYPVVVFIIAVVFIAALSVVFGYGIRWLNI